MTSNELFYESFERCRIDQAFLESFLADFCQHNPRFSERFEKVGLEQQTKIRVWHVLEVDGAEYVGI